MHSRECDIAIVGAGAAGLTAAIFALAEEPEARVLVLDGAAKIGAKILISGGGRCNVTHDEVTPEDFNGNRNAIGKVLRTFTVAQTIDWFSSIGVELKREDTGKLFPVTDRARTVLDALVRAAEGARVMTRIRVEQIERGFMVHTEQGEIHARCVILATGGRSVPKTGSDGSGYHLAHTMGHTVTDTFPALVPLVLEAHHWMTTLSGTSVEAELEVHGGSGKVLARRRGSMLLTHFGLSGPVVLDVSRDWIAARRLDASATLHASFLPGETLESLDDTIIEESRRNPRATVSSLLRGRIPERLVAELSRTAPPLGRMTKEDRRRLVRLFLDLQLPVIGDRGFDYAEVTAGGVPLDEVNLSTMASRCAEGLFLCGEILDVDGRIGGYNFQWAWASGRLAGIGAARALRD